MNSGPQFTPGQTSRLSDRLISLHQYCPPVNLNPIPKCVQSHLIELNISPELLEEGATEPVAEGVTFYVK